MGAIDENAEQIGKTLAWMESAIRNLTFHQTLIERRLDHIETEQHRQARVIAFIQRRQRAGGKLTRSLLAKQKRAVYWHGPQPELQPDTMPDPPRYRYLRDGDDIERLRSHDAGMPLGEDWTTKEDIMAKRPRPGPLGYYGYWNWADGMGNFHHDMGFIQIPPRDNMIRAQQRADLLAAAAGLSPVMGGEEEGSQRASKTTALRVPPPSTCDTCGTEIIDNCQRCGAPQCCPKCCAEAEAEHDLKPIAPVKKMTRFLLAVDENGVHIRKTLCVTHNANVGEAVYHTEPINQGALEKAIAAALIHHPENLPAFESALSCAISDLSLFNILIDSAI